MQKAVLPAALACGAILIWLAALTAVNPRPIADEQYHWPVIQGLCEGRWPEPGRLPMPPGYHLLVCILAKPMGASLFACRLACALMSIGAVLTAAGILHAMGRKAGPADNDPQWGGEDGALGDASGAARLWLLALTPILFPFTTLVYTESASILLLLTAVYMSLKRRHVSGAVLAAAACLVRQSNLVWAAFIPTWIAFREMQAWRATMSPSRPGPMIPPIAASRLSPQLREEARAAFGRVVPLWPYFLALDLLLLLMWAYPDVFIPAVEINRPRFNPAQLYSLSFFFLLLWLPVWFARMPDLWRSYVKPRLARPSMWALLAACIAAAALAFDSTHPWNQESRYIRNWPLYAMQHSRRGRIVGAAAAVASLFLVCRLTVQQPRAGELGLVWLFTLGYLAPHWLADPRYYIVTFLFLHLLVRFSPTQERVLLVWYTVLNAGVCVYILARGSPAGGIW